MSMSLRGVAVPVFVLALIWMIVTPRTAHCRTIVVGHDGTEDFTELSEAIFSLQDGDSIVVMPGDYEDPYGYEDEISVSDIEWTMLGTRSDVTRISGFRLRLINCNTLFSNLTFYRVRDALTQQGGTLGCSQVDFVECEAAEWNIATLVAVNNVFDQPELELNSCRFLRCKSNSGLEQSAGAVYAGGPTTIRRSIFLANGTSGGLAGAIQSTEDLFLEQCLFIKNSGRWGAVATNHQKAPSKIQNCTFVGNIVTELGGAVTMLDGGDLDMSETIVSSTVGGYGVVVEFHANITCSDLFDNQLGMYAGRIFTAGVFDSDPAFCDALEVDLGLMAGSPCLPGEHDGYSCGLIGAHGEGCGVSPTHETSWGRLKHRFR